MMQNKHINVINKMSDWVSIPEAVSITNQHKNKEVTESDIYRSALCGNTKLSIYFQSPIVLRRLKIYDKKHKFRFANLSFINRFIMLDVNCFLNARDFIFSTEGEYIHSPHRVIDTTLSGYEYVLVQRLLAKTLKIPLPVTGANEINYGITISVAGDIFQAFEKTTYKERIKNQIKRLPENTRPYIDGYLSSQNAIKPCDKFYFPIFDLPPDACFVMRINELDKLINNPPKNKTALPSSRISTPLSRLFWLSCKHNETISPLIRQPYKLLSIFEQWASTDGITDHLSGETLKTALERGSPSSISASN
ncbi:hypothetical protein [Klebsiella michiganensis]|uniref:hypothetical protein n=1 Tax=Klebsiella michiganensis TaxID=1134687 RepID=UPI001F4AB49A|nr:hypothetical protein [Klebsiella michiganensis]ELQ9022415.1 hypothetical protein [Klebsiella oxytoca]HCJ7646903.1 hypothetical protein [Klebsiella michiganensis]